MDAIYAIGKPVEKNEGDKNRHASRAGKGRGIPPTMRAWQLVLPVELAAKPLAFLACWLAPFRDMAEIWAMSPKKRFTGAM